MSVESVRIPELSAAGAEAVPAFRHAYGDAPEQFVEVYGDPAAASATTGPGPDQALFSWKRW